MMNCDAKLSRNEYREAQNRGSVESVDSSYLNRENENIESKNGRLTAFDARV